MVLEHFWTMRGHLHLHTWLPLSITLVAVLEDEDEVISGLRRRCSLGGPILTWNMTVYCQME